MPRKKDVPNLPDVPLDSDEDTPDVPQQFDVGALLAKDRAGPIREKYPVTDGAANFATMKQRADEALAYAKAGEKPMKEVA